MDGKELADYLEHRTIFISSGLEGDPDRRLTQIENNLIVAALRTPVAVGVPGEITDAMIDAFVRNSDSMGYGAEKGSLLWEQTEKGLRAVLALLPSPTNQGEVKPSAADRIEQLEAALKLVRGIVKDGAMTGFNCHDGDWAERLFASQADTHAALAGGE